jgi:hypothetical protein
MTSAVTAATPVTPMLRVRIRHKVSHVLALLVSSAMEELAHAQLAIDHRALGQLQFVLTSTSAATVSTIVTSTPCVQTLQGASHAHAQRISLLWAQGHLDRHALARRVLSLMATAQLQFVRDLLAPALIALAIQLLPGMQTTCDLLRAGPMELVGSRFMAVLIFLHLFLGALCVMMESQTMKLRLFVLILVPHTGGRRFLNLVEVLAKSGWTKCGVPTGGA